MELGYQVGLRISVVSSGRVKMAPWKYPVLSYCPSPRQKDSRIMSGSHVLRRDEVMCGTDDGLSFREVIAGLVPGSPVWEIRPGIFYPSLLESQCKPHSGYLLVTN